MKRKETLGTFDKHMKVLRNIVYNVWEISPVAINNIIMIYKYEGRGMSAAGRREEKIRVI